MNRIFQYCIKQRLSFMDKVFKTAFSQRYLSEKKKNKQNSFSCRERTIIIVFAYCLEKLPCGNAFELVQY